MKSIGPKAEDADEWKNCEELHCLNSKEMVVEVEHVKAHRTEMDNKHVVNEKADELSKEGAMWDEGFVAQARANTVQQEREEVYAALQYAASSHCLVEEWKDCEELKPQPKDKLIFVDKKMEETRHRTEWCAATGRYRCMRCGRGSKYMKMKGKCVGPMYLEHCLGRWGK